MRWKRNAEEDTEGKTVGRNKSRLEKREGIQRTGKKEE